MKMNTDRAAWVPFTDMPLNLEVAAHASLRWLAQESTLPPVLISDQKGVERELACLGDFDHSRHATLRSQRHLSWGARPVVCIRPTYEAVRLALHVAGAHPVAIVEAPDARLSGWASRLGAVDLLTGSPAEQHPPPLVELLEALEFQGHNAYASKMDQPHARRAIAALAEYGVSDQATILGYLCGGGVSAPGMRWVAANLPAPAAA
jgi:hypothetical protein